MHLRLREVRGRPTLGLSMELRRTRTLAWLFLIAYACTSALWAKGLVLCFEPDGHVTVEVGTGDCSDCCSVEGERGGDERSSDETRDNAPQTPRLGACACLDVALSLGGTLATHKGRGSELQRATLAVFEPTSLALLDRRAPALSARAPNSQPSSALTLLRSVVLRV